MVPRPLYDHQCPHFPDLVGDIRTGSVTADDYSEVRRRHVAVESSRRRTGNDARHRLQGLRLEICNGEYVTYVRTRIKRNRVAKEEKEEEEEEEGGEEEEEEEEGEYVVEEEDGRDDDNDVVEEEGGEEETGSHQKKRILQKE